jgi:hypothetical protein
MKNIKTVSVACAVAFAFAALWTTAATAHEWLKNGQPLTKSVNVTQKATYKWEQYGTRIEFSCTVEEKGTVGPGAAGQITSIKEVECHYLNGCQGPVTIEARKLPWNTELQTFEGGVGNHITSSQPEWRWECEFVGEQRTETCAAVPTLSVKNLSLNVEESVHGVWNTRQCSGTGLETGVEGSGVLKEENENKLSVN